MLHADWEQTKKPLRPVQNLPDVQSGGVEITFTPL